MIKYKIKIIIISSMIGLLLGLILWTIFDRINLENLFNLLLFTSCMGALGGAGGSYKYGYFFDEKMKELFSDKK